MTDEIKNAMGCCADVSCSTCKLAECNAHHIPKSIIDLINRQKTEIERLQGDNDILSKNLHNLCKELEVEKIRNF